MEFSSSGNNCGIQDLSLFSARTLWAIKTTSYPTSTHFEQPSASCIKVEAIEPSSLMSKPKILHSGGQAGSSGFKHFRGLCCHLQHPPEVSNLQASHPGGLPQSVGLNHRGLSEHRIFNPGKRQNLSILSISRGPFNPLLLHPRGLPEHRIFDPGKRPDLSILNILRGPFNLQPLLQKPSIQAATRTVPLRTLHHFRGLHNLQHPHGLPNLQNFTLENHPT